MGAAEAFARHAIEQLIIVRGAFPADAADQAEQTQRRVGRSHGPNMRKRRTFCNGAPYSAAILCEAGAARSKSVM